MTIVRLAIATFTVALLTAPAVAGVADSPLPLLSGEKSKHVFTIPGVINHASLATVIICTSLEKSKALRFAVEYFSSGGGGPEQAPQTISLAPGASQAVSTVFTTFNEFPQALAIDEDPRSARVVATSKKLTCSATVLEPGNNGTLPGVGWSLPVIKQTSQKGV